MIIFAYGTDSYRLRQYRDDVVGRYLAKYSSGTNLVPLDMAGEGSVDILAGVLRSSSFFDDHKLLVCRNVFSDKNIAGKIEDIIKESGADAAGDTTLLIAENLPEKEIASRNKIFFKFLSEKSGTVKIFEPLGGAKLNDWVVQEISSRGCSIGSRVLSELVGRVGGESQALINEIEKLTSYCGGREITGRDIELLVYSPDEPNIFELTDAVGAGNKARALQLLYINLASGRDPYYLMSVIGGHLRNMLSVKDLSLRHESQALIAKKTGIHPFVVGKISRSITGFNIEDLKKKYSGLLSIELGVKRGELNIVDALYGLVSSQTVCNKA